MLVAMNQTAAQSTANARRMRTNGKWLVVLMLWLVCFLSYADRQVIFVVFPLLSREFHLSNAQLGILSASFMVMYALTGPLAGRICDRVSRRKLVLGALIVWSICTALSSWASTYWELITAVAMTGFCEAFYFPAAMSLLSDYHAPATRSRAMATHQSAVYVGSIAGGVAAGFLGQNFGWRTGFRGFGLLGVLVGLLLLAFLREPQRGMSDPDFNPALLEHNEPQPNRVSRRRVAALLVLVFIGANFVAMAFTVWMPTYIYRHFHMNLTKAGWSGTAYMQLASIVGVFCGGILADWLVRRWSPKKGARMLVQAVGLLCAVPFLFVTGWAFTAAVALAAVSGFGLFKGIYESNIWASLYDVTPVERRGSAVGIMNSLGWLGAAVAQLVIGVASERFGLGHCLSATALLYAVIALLMFAAARYARRA